MVMLVTATGIHSTQKQVTTPADRNMWWFRTMETDDKQVPAKHDNTDKDRHWYFFKPCSAYITVEQTQPPSRQHSPVGHLLTVIFPRSSSFDCHRTFHFPGFSLWWLLSYLHPPPTTFFLHLIHLLKTSFEACCTGDCTVLVALLVDV